MSLHCTRTQLPLKKRILVDLTHDSADENDEGAMLSDRIPRLVMNLSPDPLNAVGEPSPQGTDANARVPTRPAILDSPQDSDHDAIDDDDVLIPSRPTILFRRMNLGCHVPTPLADGSGYRLYSAKSYYLSKTTAKMRRRVNTGITVSCPRGYYVECHSLTDCLKIRRQVFFRGNISIKVRLPSTITHKYILRGDPVARLTVGRCTKANILEVTQ